MIPRLIPVLLLQDNGLVKTKRFKNPTYIGDPINAVKIFNEKQVDELVFLDIRATLKGYSPNFDCISEIASECFMPFAYGGGIKSIEHIQKIIRLGAEKVIINSALYSNPDIIRQASEQFGRQSIIASIDVKKDIFGQYKIFSSGGTKKQKESIKDVIHKAQNYGAGEILINNIDLDGQMTGYDEKLFSQISSKIDVPLIACGGAGSMQDFRNLYQTGYVDALAAGSFFVFQGKHNAVLITYPHYSKVKEIFKNV
jgi:cyclase